MSPETPDIAGWSESLLLEEKRAIQRVALHGTEAGVANGLPQLFFVGLVGASGGGHYVLLDQDAAQIVTAIAQRHLSKLDAGRKPTGLHVIEIVEIDARDRQRLQIIRCGRFLLDEAPERRALTLEHPGNESGESTGFFLKLADALEVAHTMLDALAASEHHGGGSAHPQLVRGSVHRQPIFRGAFQATDAETHFVVENLRAAAGDGVETGFLQPRDGIANRQAANFGDASDFRRREAVQMNRWEATLDGAEQILIPLDLEIGVQPALH